MNEVAFTATAWEQYIAWQTEDKKTLKRINLLIKDMQRNPFTGIGKPGFKRKLGRVLVETY